MKHLVVTGYASLDYIVNLSGQMKVDETTIIKDRLEGPWFRIGGCPTYIAKAVKTLEQRATPIMWIGSDEGSSSIVDSLVDAGISTDGLEVIKINKTPTAIMIYQPDGSSFCLYDPAFPKQEKLNSAQIKLIQNADFVCLTAGPGHLQNQIFSEISKEARVYWAVKNDPSCFDGNLCEKLSKRADVIFCNAAERKLISSTNATIIETHGKEGVSIICDNRKTHIEADPVDTFDTTGAGDTFAGAFIAAEMSGQKDPNDAAKVGLDAAESLLIERKGKIRK